jgi:lipoate-protein ligase A
MDSIKVSRVAFVVEGRQDGALNMARDDELLAEAEKGSGACRVYQWDGVWVSLGRFQRPDQDLLKPLETRWVLRPTGGKAVLHGHDLTVGLALPLACMATQEVSSERLARSVRLVYAALAAPLVGALNDCGLPAALAESTPFVGRGPKTADCFAHVSPNDIVDRRMGSKVCGCALRLTPAAVLVQASIPYAAPEIDAPLLIRRATPVSASLWDWRSFAEALRARVTGLSSG